MENPRKCAAPGCDSPVTGHRILCVFHFYTLDRATRSEVTEFVRMGAFGLAIEKAQSFFESGIYKELG